MRRRRLTIGFASDLLQPTYGVQSVRIVLMGAAVLYLVPAFLDWRAARHARDEVAVTFPERVP